MPSERARFFIGVTMIGLGLIQTILFATMDYWLAAGFGAIYSGLGVLYLWTEVYRDR